MQIFSLSQTFYSFVCLLILHYAAPVPVAQSMQPSGFCAQHQEMSKLATDNLIDLNTIDVPGLQSNLFWSPDGRYFAIQNNLRGDGSYTIKIFEAQNIQKVVVQLDVPDQFQAIAWSPDSRYVLAVPESDDSSVRILDVIKKEVRSIERDSGILINGEIKWSPDSRYFAFRGKSSQSGNQKEVIQVLSPSNLQESILVEYSHHVADFSWSPDSHSIATAGLGEATSIIRLSGERHSQALEIPQEPGEVFEYIDWLEKNNLLIASAESIVITDVMTGETRQQQYFFDSLYQISPNKRYLVVRVFDDKGSSVNLSSTTTQVIDLETDEPVLETQYGVTHSAQPQHRIAWSPNSQYLAINDRGCGIYVYSVATGEVLITRGMISNDIPREPFEIMAFDWSPDGKYLAVFGKDETFRIIEVAKRREVARLSEFAPRVWKVLWSPDGKRIAVVDEKLRMIELGE
ncbi:MAG: WD40 repeat domain-containing protein [Cyanobacteria bacterium P01_G01_bin.54]